MTAKILKSCWTILLVLAISIGLVGCTEKAYVDRPVDVLVPQKVKLPKVVCYPEQKTYTEKVKEMRLCIERYKQVISEYEGE